MLWPEGQTISAIQFQSPPGYSLRTYQPSDETGFYGLMAKAGWPGWDAERLRPWLFRSLPEGWFMLTEETRGNIVATCMATHDPTWLVPFCGEVGWTAVHPEHQGKGLGNIVVAAVIERFLQAGYTCIHLYTEVWRFAALKMYFKLGFVPLLDPPQSIDQWQEICARLNWPFTPEAWVRSIK